jgi:hypothetical protein
LAASFFFFSKSQFSNSFWCNVAHLG